MCIGAVETEVEAEAHAIESGGSVGVDRRHDGVVQGDHPSFSGQVGIRRGRALHQSNLDAVGGLVTEHRYSARVSRRRLGRRRATAFQHPPRFIEIARSEEGEAQQPYAITVSRRQIERCVGQLEPGAPGPGRLPPLRRAAEQRFVEAGSDVQIGYGDEDAIEGIDHRKSRTSAMWPAMAAAAAMGGLIKWVRPPRP